MGGRLARHPNPNCWTILLIPIKTMGTVILIVQCGMLLQLFYCSGGRLSIDNAFCDDIKATSILRESEDGVLMRPTSSILTIPYIVPVWFTLCSIYLIIGEALLPSLLPGSLLSSSILLYMYS
jgi:hypothetical protein